MIMKKRTMFERSLVRRVAKKEDYLRYAAYEMGLEQLRRKRVARMDIKTGPATISDYALVRRQFHIFERAVNKFKSDVALWVQYIEVAKKEGARALVGRITARALQLHPNKPGLFILAASHELDHQSPSAARVLLQRGIRLNPESLDIWKEYVKMELGFIESLRRRWDVLGIKVSKTKKEEKPDPSQQIMGERIIEEENEEAAKMEADYEGDEARRMVMEGGIVESVISSAARAIPRLELFECIKGVIRNYPSPESLRRKLLDHLYGEVRRTLPRDARAVVFAARRMLTEETRGKELVEGLRVANGEMLARIGEAGMVEEYTKFVEEWCGKDIDIALKEYLVGSLGRVSGVVGGTPAKLREKYGIAHVL
ncbi:hypothetical protein CPC08DRAFT_501356 [Agrocybe pediades]|nr:hypothetical protein CPC08DRAFT_501356 [Agrocybe pediades]